MLKDNPHEHPVNLRSPKYIRRHRENCEACPLRIIEVLRYSCRHDGCYALHKFCGELSLEIKHELHESHPLTLTTNPTRRCDACGGKQSKGFHYRCEECDFGLDLICATLPDRKLNHHGHPHPLTPTPREIEARCYCCGKRHEGFFYYCEECANFWIHEDCAAVKQIVTNSNVHPEHALNLIYPGQEHKDLLCSVCHTRVDLHKSWHLQCYECEFASHMFCAIGKNLEVEGPDIRHLRQEDRDGAFGIVGLNNHTLELFRLDETADIRSCVACTQGIIDHSYYNCPEVGCDYFLHKFCGELPLEIKHASHQSHPLKLTSIRAHIWRWCNACKKYSEGFHYRCEEECDFGLDLICATLADRKVEHHGHHHPLTITRSEIEASCNCCGEEHKGIFYHCQKCAIFWIHQDCAALGPEVKAPNHPHPLHFVYSGQDYDSIRCDICNQSVDNRSSWCLRCGPCEFWAHVRCAMDEKSQELEETPLQLPHLPWEVNVGESGVIGFLNNEIGTNDEVDKEKMKIYHFSHPEHELILLHEVPKVVDPYHGHQISISAKCNGCTTNISSPFYSCCLGCDFLLHKCCAELPSSIPPQWHHQFHDFHKPVNLVQTRKVWRYEEGFECSLCKAYCNGFCFECEGKYCEYKLDVVCAFKPTCIVHKAHHPFHALNLTYDREKWRMASCCKQDTDPRKYFSKFTQPSYECSKCEFTIHFNCAMYPGRVSHRYDHENPFKLWYDRGAVEANNFYCERCEESMEPKEWYYHSKSFNGDQLMHPKCILQKETPELLRMKATKSILLGDIHPHQLHFVPVKKFKCVCGYCEERISDYDDEWWTMCYACWESDCDFYLHPSCEEILGLTDSTIAEEYPHESLES